MGEHVLPGDPPLTVALRRSDRARRITLRVSHRDGRVTLTLPRRTPEREGLAFLRAREDWVRGHLDRVAPPRPVQLGGTIPYLGREIALRPGPVRAPRLEDGALLLPRDPDRAPARAMAFLKARARDVLAEAVDRHAAALGRRVGRLSLRDTRSRWGSCSSTGDIMLSWRLVMAPPAIGDYVAAHEVAHLAEMNHSAAFWAVCERLYPDHRAARDWLRRNGDALQRIDFAPMTEAAS
ncbi:SprT family zinc-dependent metalloprotease [Limimaricola variabilis]|uniref:M48 family metallopeptidase n=1 Tax=Limimaricola variabilis TaxID=1492771 RepID=UPI002AC997E4|nr:SprT family zinc-dependent metalloprotease [Limimaricola variabilis]WPY93363.1 SprT family zinc-dependent metalloprotease [Limimaricola variabilis]